MVSNQTEFEEFQFEVLYKNITHSDSDSDPKNVLIISILLSVIALVAIIIVVVIFLKRNKVNKSGDIITNSYNINSYNKNENMQFMELMNVEEKEKPFSPNGDNYYYGGEKSYW